MRPFVWTLALALATSLVARAGKARATPASRCGAWVWRAVSGTVSPGAVCDVVVLTAEPSTGDRSTGRMMYEGLVSGRGRHSVTVQRLTADHGSLHVEFPGGYLLLSHGRVGLYTSEAQWAAEGFRPLPPALARRRMIEPGRVEVELGDTTVVARIDGIEVGRWTVGRLPQSGGFSVWILAPRATRARVRISDWRLLPG